MCPQFVVWSQQRVAAARSRLAVTGAPRVLKVVAQTVQGLLKPASVLVWVQAEAQALVQDPAFVVVQLAPALKGECQ